MAAIKAGRSDFILFLFNIQRARWFIVSLTFNQILCFIKHSGIRYPGEAGWELDLYIRSLALKEELGHKEGIAASLNNLGVIEQARGNLDAAVDLHTRSLALEEELGNKQGIAASLNNLGMIEQARGNLDAACSLWERSAEVFAEIGATSRHAIVQSWIGTNCAETL
jgi:tetratricopeptide (TPR) repeat protein